MNAHLPRLARWLRVACIPPLLVGAAVGGVFAQEWECQQCPRRSVAVFDVAHPEPASDVTLLTSEYLHMQLADGGLLTKLLREDPSRECIDFVSAGFAQADDPEEGGYTVESGLPGLPPGAVPGADYVVSGEISAGDDGNYVLTVRLQAGGTREEVASGSAAWDLESGATVSTAEAAKSLMPLMVKIREFERMKRDTMTAVAIGPERGLEISADPQVINRGGTSEVTIRLTDCDGVPLKNRFVAPTRDKGGDLIVPTMPVTDGNGELRASFSMRELETRATVFAEYHYVPPFSARDERGTTASTVIAAGEIFTWVRIRKTVRINRSHDDRDEWDTVKRGRYEEVIDVQVTMTPDYSSVEVEKEFDVAARRFVPREYTYEIFEEERPEINRNIYRTESTRYERSSDGRHGVDSSSQSFGRFEVDNVGNPFLTFRVDPSGQVTYVSLPGVRLISDYEQHTSCTKTVNGETEDCSSSSSYTKQIGMFPGQADDDCYIPKEQSLMRIAGGCHWIAHNTQERWEEHEFDWSVILFGRRE